jgi:hypothetical protein
MRHLSLFGPANRSTILETTGIPNGSLSVLLQDPDFVKDEAGRWTVRVKEETE